MTPRGRLSWIRHSALRIAVLVLSAVLFASCNGILGIGEPTDPETPSGGTAGTLDTTGGISSGGVASAGSGGSHQGGVSGTNATGGAAGETGGAAGETGGAAGAAGEAGDSGGITPVRITTVTLPTALFDVHFDFQFQATGGGGRPYVWSTSDDLPDGLELTEDGRLQGTPGAEGIFDIEVSVAEEGTSVAVTTGFRVQVIRKRWLVYKSDEVARGAFLLYAVDVTDPLNKKIPLVRSDPPRYISVWHYAFSPDGNYLAFTAIAYDTYNLFVVDMSGREPGEPRLVGNELLNVGTFNWSPDSRHLAYAKFPPTGIPVQVYAADVTRPNNALLVGETASWLGLGWVNDELLAYSSNETIFYRRRPFAESDEEKSLTLLGTVWQRWPERDVALFGTSRDNCMWGRWHFVDFRESELAVQEFANGAVFGSPAMDYVAYREPVYGRYDIYRAFDTESVASFSSPLTERACSEGAWSNDGLVFAAGGEGGRLVVTTIRDGVADVRALPGDYGRVGERFAPSFSANDEWLGFPTETGTYVARNDSGTFEPVLAVDPDARPSSTGGDSHYKFSPDSKFIAYAEPGESHLVARFFLADLRGEEPNGAALPLPDAEIGTGISALEWSSHSTEMALRVRNASRAPDELYLVTQATSNPIITKVNGPMTCTDIYTPCQMVESFAFQP